MNIEEEKEFLIKEESHEKLLNAMNDSHKDFNQFKDLPVSEMLQEAARIIAESNYRKQVISHQKETINKLKNQIR